MLVFLGVYLPLCPETPVFELKVKHHWAGWISPWIRFMKCWAIYVAYRRSRNTMRGTEQSNHTKILVTLARKSMEKIQVLPSMESGISNMSAPVLYPPVLLSSPYIPYAAEIRLLLSWLDTPHINVRKPSFKKRSLLITLGTHSPQNAITTGEFSPSPGNFRQNRLKPRYLRLEKGHAPVHRANLEDSAGWRFCFLFGWQWRYIYILYYIYIPHGPHPWTSVKKIQSPGLYTFLVGEWIQVMFWWTCWWGQNHENLPL